MGTSLDWIWNKERRRAVKRDLCLSTVVSARIYSYNMGNLGPIT